MEAKTPQPPSDLSGEALNEWHRTCDELKSLGQLNAADRAILHLHCRTWATWIQADATVIKDGAIATYSSNQGASPSFKTAMEAAKLDRQLLTDLGLTPKARKRDDTKAPSAPRRLRI